MALSKTTQDHDEIRQWAESRGALPAEVASTETANQTGILRFEFPKATNANDSALKQISWDDFFEKFDQSGLALVYQDVTADGEKSNFNKLIYPEDESSSSGDKAKSSSAKSASPKSSHSTASKSAKKTPSAKK